MAEMIMTQFISGEMYVRKIDFDRAIAVAVSRAEHAESELAASRARVEALTAALDTAVALLGELVDDEPCHLDHHGNCQTHSYIGAPCAVEEARLFIAARAALQPTGAGLARELKALVEKWRIDCDEGEEPDQYGPGPSNESIHRCLMELRTVIERTLQ